ncbi:sulfotransferase [Rhizobium sp. KVB221]|uniref:Sulfotransferase n=2 Tax=Rhizobium setariae TaxID=2801340 RepID=A0A936YMM7_9HYPH|nr:sulfotransferase [Rhizobium setariae]
MALPNFICIGAQKAGTSWLYQMLIQHPDLWLPPLKELHFFDRNAASESSKEVVRKLVAKAKRKYLSRADQSFDQAKPYWTYLDSIAAEDMLTETWYKRIFDYPGASSKITGEITPAYLDMRKKKLAYAMDFLPKETKFIAIVREPLARALSQIRMWAETKKVTPATEQDWQVFIDHLTKVTRGNYMKSIPMWNTKAGKHRILYLPFSDVRDRPQELLGAVEDFIGASHYDGYKEIDEQVHTTKKIAIPEWVTKKVEADIQPQRRFLINTFGNEFYEKTK